MTPPRNDWCLFAGTREGGSHPTTSQQSPSWFPHTIQTIFPLPTRAAGPWRPSVGARVAVFW